MASCHWKGLSKRFGTHTAVDGLTLGRREGRVRLAAGPVGLRQDHDPADDRGLRRAERRRDPARRPRSSGHEAGQARARHRVPELCALPAHDGGGERGVRPRDAGRRRRRAHQARRRDAGAGRPRRLHRPLPAPALGRPAAARGAGPRSRDPAADPAARRAAFQSRRQAARGDADRVAPDPAHGRHDHDPGDARPGRGDGAQRPRGGDEPRPRRADRPAARGLRAAGDAVRRELPRPDQPRERRDGAAGEDLVRDLRSRRQGAHAHLPGQPLALPDRDGRRPGHRDPPEHRRGDAGGG